MNMKLGVALLALPISATAFMGMGASKTASASYDSFIQGGTGAGVIATGGSSIEVQREVLTISVPELSSGSGDLADGAARVSAEYTFYNPAEQDETMSLLFPVGSSCSYFEQMCSRKDIYTVSLDGKRILPSVRYSFFSTTELDVVNEAQLLSQTRREDAFYTEEKPVTTYTYEYQRENGRSCDFFHFIIKYNPAKTRLMFGDSAKISIEDGKAHAVWQSSDISGEVEIHFVGEPAEAIEFYVSADAAGKERTEVSKFVSADKRICTFGEFTEALRPEEIGEIDWYNGFVDLLNTKCSRYGYSNVACNFVDKNWFRPWYEYSVTVPAGGTAVNTVTSALLPNVDTRGPVYSYEYLLSPAAKWQKFGEFIINIDTPYYLYQSSLGFEKREGGYTLSRSGLPLGELTFTLAERENVTLGARNSPLSPSTKVAIVLLSVLGSVVIIGGLTAFFVTRKSKHKN